jgi:uncharacterized protein
MDPIKLIQKYYKTDSKAYSLLIPHSKAVTKKALEIAARVPNLKPDLKFIKEAAMLHDIGIFLVNDPELNCFGDMPYVCHGYLGREILEKEGLPRHALVCERHVGTGLTIKDIEKQNIPAPKRDMLPVSIEEKIICFADKFFSKNKKFLQKEKSIEQIRKGLAKFGEDKVETFNDFFKEFGE